MHFGRILSSLLILRAQCVAPWLDSVCPLNKMSGPTPSRADYNGHSASMSPVRLSSETSNLTQTGQVPDLVQCLLSRAIYLPCEKNSSAPDHWPPRYAPSYPATHSRATVSQPASSVETGASLSSWSLRCARITHSTGVPSKFWRLLLNC